MIAWFNCELGVAGDMVLGALVDAGADADHVAATIAALDIDGYELSFQPVRRASLQATWANVVVADHGDRDGDGHHSHPHRPLRTILELLDGADRLAAPVRDRAVAVFRELGRAEGAVHGIDPYDVELHEVGAVDAIVDVVGVCAALDSLGVDTVHASAIGVGHGIASTAHGTIPHPAPAVARMLADRRVPVRPVETSLETATPTGVALMVALAASFGAAPTMTVTATGMGAGTADPSNRPNVVGVLVGHGASATAAGDRLAHQIETNVDDVTGEVLADTITALLDAGALDAWVTSIVMKKGRPAHTVSVLARGGEHDLLRDVLVAHTGTLGTRSRVVERHPVAHETGVVTVDGHDVSVKRAAGRTKVEFDDAAAAAGHLGLPVRTVLRLAESGEESPPPTG
ncbi:MAG: nickel pincer cofactor biosynthesis protein LarC [Actinomycetota bacterium]|nr:nickel pincer cofactor biosynthesis protein LarC [Actinomycetota bacterium]